MPIWLNLRKVVHWKQMDANTHACQQLNMELADARRPDCQVEIGKLHLALNRLTI